jgi:hypothetical protein
LEGERKGEEREREREEEEREREMERERSAGVSPRIIYLKQVGQVL